MINLKEKLKLKMSTSTESLSQTTISTVSTISAKDVVAVKEVVTDHFTGGFSSELFAMILYLKDVIKKRTGDSFDSEQFDKLVIIHYPSLSEFIEADNEKKRVAKEKKEKAKKDDTHDAEKEKIERIIAELTSDEDGVPCRKASCYNKRKKVDEEKRLCCYKMSRVKPDIKKKIADDYGKKFTLYYCSRTATIHKDTGGWCSGHSKHAQATGKKK